MTVEELRTMNALQNACSKINDFTIRDFYAGMALMGLISKYKFTPHDSIIDESFEYADRILERRKNK